MFYLICFGILFLLAVLNVQMHDKLSSQVLGGLSAILLICIAGLRYETGGDWDSYAELFGDYPSFSRLIGNPVEHTMSPAIHNFLAGQTGQNLVYLPFPVKDGEKLGDAVRGALSMDFLGLNVTVPYKSDVIPFLKETDELAAQR